MVLYVKVYIYTITVSTDGVPVYVCSCMQLVIACVPYYWLYMCIDCSMPIYVTIVKFQIASMLLFESYNITTSHFL